MATNSRATLVVRCGAIAIAIAACGPRSEDEVELRCAEADFDVAPASGPTPGPCAAQTDNAADGTIDFWETWEYHPLGEPLRIEFRNDEGGMMRFQFGHDEQGRLTWRTQEGADGTLMSRWDREYVAADLVIHTDSLPDGTVTSVSRIELDEHGEPLVSRSDDDLDGRVDSRTTTERDADGRELETSIESLEQVWTPWYTFSYEYDDDGFLVETHYDYHRPSTSQHDSITYRTNDAWGNAVVEEHIDLVDDEHMCTYYSQVCDG